MNEEIKVPEVVKEVVPGEPSPNINEVKEDVIEHLAISKTNEEAAKEMLAILSDNENVALAEAAIHNNELEFELDTILYKVRKSTFAEKQAANKYRMKKFIELLKDPDTILEKDLKKLYKNKGIDLDGVEKQLLELDSQQKSLMLTLGQAIKENKSKVELEKYKVEIIQISNTIQELNQQKQQLLEFSLENRILMDVYSYMIWMISEKKVGDNWVKVWNKFEDFLNCTNSELVTKITKLGAIVVTEDMMNRSK